MIRITVRITIASIVAACACAAGKATAATAAAVDARQEAGLEEVIVTAERRSESLQTMAAAVSALSAAELEKNAIVDLTGLQQVSPSITVQDVGFLKYISVRGVGLNASAPGLSTGIAYHVDGLFTREFGTPTPYYDLQRVEILRGPQGTLAGQNATGGAIFVVSHKPDYNTTEAAGSMSYGSFRHLSADAALNAPLSDTVAVRLAAYVDNRDSYYTNYVPGTSDKSPSQPGNISRYAVRLSVAAKPSDKLEMLLRAEQFQSRSDGYGRKITGDPIADPFVTSLDIPMKADLSIERLSFELKYNIGDSMQFRSLTGYQRNDTNHIDDADGTDVVTPAATQQIIQPIFSQEFNLLSTGNGPVQWVVGAYYFNALKDGGSAKLSNAAVYVKGAPFNDSKAVFGQLTWDLSDRLQVVGGLRYNKDHGGDTPAIQLLFLPGQPTIHLAATQDSTATTGKLGINYKVSPTQFIYALASKGYRAGGTNFPPDPNFGPESIVNYEAGWKSEYLNKHLRTQLDAYYNTYDKVQLSVINPLTLNSAIFNAGDARNSGVEAQIQGVFGGLSLDATAAYLKSELGEALYADPAGGSPTPVQLKGRPLPMAPKTTASVGIQYQMAMGNGATLTPRLQYSYTGQQWATVFQDAGDRIEAISLLGLRLTYERNNYSLAAYATNLGDKTYQAGKDSNGYLYYGAPREIGLRLGMKF